MSLRTGRKSSVQGSTRRHRERDPDDGRAFRIVLTAKARRFEPVAEHTLTDLNALARERLGDRRLRSVKHALEEWIET
jgi:DNA-binding MarR family transcriptional regulator